MSGTSITTILRYDDPSRASEWLCGAFGFEQQHVEQDGDGDVSYISLSFGESSILVCPIDSPLFEELIVQPKEIGNRSTLTCYLTVEDVAKHCAAARTRGAQIVREPIADDTGHEFYVCRDPDGHLWSFGNRTYAQVALRKTGPPERRRSRLAGLSALLSVAVVAAAAGGGGMLYIAKDGRHSLPAWITTFVSGSDVYQPASTQHPMNATAPRPAGDGEGDAWRLAELQKTLSSARASLERIKRERETTTADLRALRAQVEKRTAENDRVRAKLKAVQAQLKRERIASEGRIKQAAEALAVASRRARESEQQHIALRAQVEKKQRTLEQAEAETKRLETAVASLKSTLERAGGAKTEAYARLEKLYRQAQHDTEAARRALENAQKAAADAKAAQAATETRAAALDEKLKKTVQALATIQAEKEKAVTELDRVVAEARAKQDDLNKEHAKDIVVARMAAKERAQFKATLETLNGRLQSMLAALVHARRDKDAADQTLENAKRGSGRTAADNEKRLVALAAAYERVGLALKNERLSLAEIEGAFNEARAQLARVQAAERKLSAELSKARGQLKNSRRDHEVRVAILQAFDTEAEVQRVERALRRKRREPLPPLPTPKGTQAPTTVVALPRQPAVTPPDAPERSEGRAAEGSETCARAARRRLSNFLGWRSPKSTSAIEHLCRGAETSVEPVECFRKVIWGTASWGRGGNRPWSVKNALTICSGTLSARHTLLCLKRQLQSRTHWRLAIEQCMTNW